ARVRNHEIDRLTLRRRGGDKEPERQEYQDRRREEARDSPGARPQPARPHQNSNGSGKSSESLRRFVAPPVVAMTTGMSPANSQRIWRQAPHGGVGSEAPVTTAIPVNRRTPSERAFQTATRSAHTVRPYVEFSTLQPVKSVPSAASRAAPTANPLR